MAELHDAMAMTGSRWKEVWLNSSALELIMAYNAMEVSINIHLLVHIRIA